MDKFINTKPIRLIELFAGIGSQAKALKNLHIPFESHFVCEYDGFAVASYNAIHGTNYEICNIMDITAADLNITHTHQFTYLLTYSFPCQDLSVAGKGAGMEKGSGTRSGLLWEVERLLNECVELPQLLLMENVTQVHGTKNKGDFDRWIKFLESKGYKNYWQDLNSKDFGMPQNRNRCIMVSILGDYSFEFPQKTTLKLEMRNLLESDVSEEYDVNHDCYNYYLDMEDKQNGTKWQGRCNNDVINPVIAHTLSVRGTRHQRPGVSNIISKKNTHEISVREYKKNFSIGDLRWLTPKECWRLMGFNDNDFAKAKAVCNNTQLYKQAGNSIVVNMLMAVFWELLL